MRLCLSDPSKAMRGSVDSFDLCDQKWHCFSVSFPLSILVFVVSSGTFLSLFRPHDHAHMLCPHFCKHTQITTKQLFHLLRLVNVLTKPFVSCVRNMLCLLWPSFACVVFSWCFLLTICAWCFIHQSSLSIETIQPTPSSNNCSTCALSSYLSLAFHIAITHSPPISQ